MSIKDVEKFKKLAKEFDARIQTREQAFEQLVKEGIYNRDGTLTEQYGGKKKIDEDKSNK